MFLSVPVVSILGMCVFIWLSELANDNADRIERSDQAPIR